MDEEDVKRPTAHEVGMALDKMSVDELQQRIAMLEREIERLRSAIAAKQQSRAAADAFFKL
jgi:uncharacterized small protein (DUF1192 family)